MHHFFSIFLLVITLDGCRIPNENDIKLIIEKNIPGLMMIEEPLCQFHFHDSAFNLYNRIKVAGSETLARCQVVCRRETETVRNFLTDAGGQGMPKSETDRFKVTKVPQPPVILEKMWAYGIQKYADAVSIYHRVWLEIKPRKRILNRFRLP